MNPNDKIRIKAKICMILSEYDKEHHVADIVSGFELDEQEIALDVMATMYKQGKLVTTAGVARFREADRGYLSYQYYLDVLLRRIKAHMTHHNLKYRHGFSDKVLDMIKGCPDV